MTFSTLEQGIIPVFQRFIDDPTYQHLYSAGPAAQTFGAPQELAPAILQFIQRLRDGAESLDEKRVQSALTLCSHLGVLLQNAAIADAVAQVCLNKARTITERQSIHDAIFLIVESSAAFADRQAADAFITQACEALARILPVNQLLWDLVQLLEGLVIVDPSLAATLGRAINTARISAPQSSL